MDAESLLMCLMPIAVGIILLVVMLVIRRNGRRSDDRRSRRTYGTVTDNIYSTSHVGVGADERVTSAYYPVVTFMDDRGVEHSECSRYGEGKIRYPVGSRVQIWYNPSDPSDFHMDNHDDFIKIPTMILGIMSAGFILMGAVFLFLLTRGTV